MSLPWPRVIMCAPVPSVVMETVPSDSEDASKVNTAVVIVEASTVSDLVAAIVWS